MSKLNCWEALQCGMEPGGRNVDRFGVCPAATFAAADGFLGGKNGGRACVYITGTFCSGTIQGTHKDKQKQCHKCSFYQEVKREHGSGMTFYRFYEYVLPRLGEEDEKKVAT